MELRERIAELQTSWAEHETAIAQVEAEIADLAPGQARLVDWPAERYHADTDCVSRSQLWDLRNSPALYYAKHEARTMQPDRPSPAMELGTYVHQAVLEPDQWARRLYNKPAPVKPERPEMANGRAKAGTPERDLYEHWKDDEAAWRDAYDLWVAERPDDAISLPRKTLDQINAMAASVHSHSFASILLREGGANEQTVLWRHPETEMLVRIRADRIWQFDAETVTVPDLKTTQDPSPRLFGSSMARFGYHFQGALYLDAIQALYPGIELHFVFVVVRSSAPYETACYELDPHDLALGRAQYLAAMRDLQRRRVENDWIAEWQRGCRGITLPGWAHYEDQET
jgi:hypothetical protein